MGGIEICRKRNAQQYTVFLHSILSRTDLLVECESESEFFPRLTSDVNIEIL